MPARLAPDVATPPLRACATREAAVEAPVVLHALPGGRVTSSKPRVARSSRTHAALSRVPTLPLRLAL
jgi:hypothetical protein